MNYLDVGGGLMRRTFSKRQTQVKELRIEQKLTLEKVAQILGITLQRVWQIEQDVRKKLLYFGEE